MKIQCSREALAAALSLVQVAVAPRTTKAVLTNVKAIATADSLTLMANDLEVGIRYELRGVNVQSVGAAILPPGRLSAILRETRDENITIHSDDESTIIRTSQGRFQLPAYDPNEFLDVPAFDDGGSYQEITAGVLRTMIKRTAFAADRKEGTARWAVTGILWEFEGKLARLVATDTKRLAKIEGMATLHGDPPGGEKGPSHLVPQKAIQLLERSLHDDGEQIRVSMSANQAMFQTERALIHTQLVEGRFPPYRDIIPKKPGITLQLPTAEFLSCVRQAAIMTDDETKRVEFRFEPGKVTLKAQGATTGSSEVELSLPDFNGGPVEIAFDPQYIIEMLKAIEGEPNLILELTDGQRPAVFRIGEHYLYLVMPLAG